jgi:hypothetical protein
VAPLLELDPGYHDLASTPESGAWDLIRHPALGSAAGPFATGSFLEATVAFEALLVPGQRTFVLGQPFDPPRPGEPPDLGMHEIHQNQGDPEDSEWSHLNAIWQDGGTMTERPDGTLHAFISKFSSQKDETGADGHPLHLNVSGAASEG